MAKLKRIRGTRDILPEAAVRWQYIERLVTEVAATYGFGEIRVPTLEKTELFQRSVGETTDVVQKEMYTFDMGRESLTLRPEGTAGVVRAVLENGLLNDALPLKLCYILSCFRHEKPQAGRYREFDQFGLEVFGSAAPSQDAEVISVANDILSRIGIKEVQLQINSIGCPQCRPAYHEKLIAYYREREHELCELCRDRLEKNPLRLLDCKEEGCAALKADAPRSINHLCSDCEEHFLGLKASLEAIGIPYIVNSDIVRGLDYYTRTVFEFVSQRIGSQGTVCGGGRYDSLVEMMGGAPTPGLGFGMGIDRIIMVAEQEGCEFPLPKACDIYLGSMGEKESFLAQEITAQLRREGFYALCDTMGRSVKAQMKYADKTGAHFSCIIGSNELENASVSMKDMHSGEAAQVALNAKAVADFLYSRIADSIEVSL